MKSGIKELSEEAYKSKLRCHAKFYKKKLIVDSTKIYNHYYNKNNENNENNENNKSSVNKVTLGNYRHFGIFCNYDQIIEMIVVKWEDKYPVFSRDLIHNLSNKLNELIFDAIVNTKDNKNEFNNHR